jgi:hypothetical protein
MIAMPSVSKNLKEIHEDFAVLVKYTATARTVSLDKHGHLQSLLES